MGRFTCACWQTDFPHPYELILQDHFLGIGDRVRRLLRVHEPKTDDANGNRTENEDRDDQAL